MSTVFTTYLRSLDPSGEPDPASFDRVWKALRGVLKSEVKRRGLWESSPVLLGLHGWGPRWWSPGEGGGRSGDALDELAADCYVYVFVDRLRILRAHLRHKPNVDGLVFRCVRNYLHDVQKRQDPLGFRIFSLVKAALSELARRGDLHRLSGGRRIGNDTVFGLRPGAEPSQAADPDLAGIVRSWCDDLAGELVAGHGAGVERATSCLERRILSLSGHGIEVFRADGLIDPLKRAMRARWASFFEESEGERALEDLGSGFTEVVRVVRPDRGYEDRESFDHLVACVTEGLDKLGERRRTRQYLAALWRFLKSYAVESSLAGADAERLPSRRKLARHLGIPRDRFRELFGTLRQLVADCTQANSGTPEVSSGRTRKRRPARVTGKKEAKWTRTGGMASRGGQPRPGSVTPPGWPSFDGGDTR